MKHRNRARAWWVRIHLWLGLSAGVVFALLGLTGSVLVFHDTLDQWLNPDLLTADPATRRIAPSRAVAVAEGALPNGAHVAWLSWPGDAEGVFRAWGGPVDHRFERMIAVDPASGDILGERAGDGGLLHFIYELHFQLGLGPGGQAVVGTVGLLMLISLGTGLYLWWPRRRHWRTGLTIRRGARPQRRDYDLHRVTGIYGVVLLAVSTGTGIFMALPDATEPVVAVFSPVTPPAGRIESHGATGAAPIGVDAAVRIGRTALPDAEVTGIGLPGPRGGTYRVALHEPVHPRASAGRSYVRVDHLTGEVRAIRNWDGMTAADRFYDWQLPVHNGEAFGRAGRLVAFAVGFLPLGMLVTGVCIWRHKRRAASMHGRRSGRRRAYRRRR